ncbi:MAG: hypothetical protein WAV93_12930, partial [Bacteroidales bacterium]
MRKYLFATLFAIMLSATVINGQEKYLSGPVTHVNVFRQGAQISGDLPVSVQPGTVDFVAGGLSPFIDPNSIQ